MCNRYHGQATCPHRQNTCLLVGTHDLMDKLSQQAAICHDGSDNDQSLSCNSSILAEKDMLKELWILLK